MSKFNAVFAIVKKQSATHVKQRTDIFTICHEAEMQPDRVEFYLQCLSEIGVLQYAKEDRSVWLTEKGQLKEKIFPC